MHDKRKIAILGSTGSIGTQTLDVIRRNPDRFSAEILVANKNWELLAKQAIEFQPNAVVIADKEKYPLLRDALEKYSIKVFAGSESVNSAVEFETVDMVLAAMVGYSGLVPTVNALRHKKPVALANKETLVAAGKIVISEAAKNGVPVLPVDSEHSAIFQSLAGEGGNAIEKILLTASGGPFRGKTRDYLKTVKKEQALKHPNWNMGGKITIDSATLMNKGLEIMYNNFNMTITDDIYQYMRDGLDSYKLVPNWNGDGTIKCVLDPGTDYQLNKAYSELQSTVTQATEDIFMSAPVVKLIDIYATVNVDIDQLNPFSNVEKSEIQARIISAIKVFIDGGYASDGSWYPGLILGEDFIPHKLAVFLDDEIPELKNINFHTPEDYVTILDEEVGTSNIITIEMI